MERGPTTAQTLLLRSDRENRRAASGVDTGIERRGCGSPRANAVIGARSLTYAPRRDGSHYAHYVLCKLWVECLTLVLKAVGPLQVGIGWQQLGTMGRPLKVIPTNISACFSASHPSQHTQDAKDSCHHRSCLCHLAFPLECTKHWTLRARIIKPSSPEVFLLGICPCMEESRPKMCLPGTKEAMVREAQVTFEC